MWEPPGKPQKCPRPYYIIWNVPGQEYRSEEKK